MKFLDIFNLRLKITEFSEEIEDNDIIPIIYDEQFALLKYDFDILYIIEKISVPNALVMNKTADDIKIWVNNFITQISNLSKHTYTEDEIILFETYYFYRILFDNATTYINQNTVSDYIDDITNILSKSFDENSSSWLAKECLRIVLLRIYSMSAVALQNNMDTIKSQLKISQQNANKKDSMQLILNKISYNS